MPSMANITVKAANGTTDVVYTALTPSSGDKTSAIWRNESAGSIPGFRPQLAMVASQSSTGVRRIKTSYIYPVTHNDASGQPVSDGKFILTVEATVPQSLPDTMAAEMVAQSTNLHASTLVRECLKTAYAPQ